METKENEGGKKRPAAAKAAGIVLNVLFVCFFVLCMAALILALSTRGDDGSARLFGRELRIVVSGSMEQCDETDVRAYEIKDIPIHSLIFIETVPEDEKDAEQWYNDLKVGDVLTFRYVYDRQETITHRIVAITPKETGGLIIELEGDNKSSSEGALRQTIDTSQEDSPNYVIGKVTGKSVALGYLITAVQSPWGIVFIVIVPCLIIIAFEVVRIVGIATEKKRAARQDEQRRKDEEIAELKRQLAAAGGFAQDGADTQGDPAERAAGSRKDPNSGAQSDEDKKR